MRRVRWFVYGALGIHVLLALLLLGKHPLLFRGGLLLLPQSPSAQGGMRLAVYRDLSRSGTGQIRFTPGAFARLEIPHTSLDAYALWHVQTPGTYTLVFRCDDHGAVFIDGHRVIGLIGTSVNNVGQAAVPLEPGRHLLVVHLSSGAGQGWFTLEAQGPGEQSFGPLPPQDLHPVSQRYVPYWWRWVYGGRTWIRGAMFWVTFIMLLVAAPALHQARSLRQAALNAILIIGSSTIALVLGETAIRLVLPPPQRVSFRTSSGSRPADERRDVFMIPTERGFRHSPNSEVVDEDNPLSPGTPLVYRTNSLGYRNREVGPRGGERILFLGDSITFGLGLNEEHTFVRRVEDLARREGKNWETINAAVNGLGTNGEIAVFNETGLSVEPDVVVLGFYLNDFLESPGIYLTALPGVLDRSWLAHQLVGVFSRHLFLSQSEREARDSPPMLKAPDEIFAWRDEFSRDSTVVPSDRTPDKATVDFNALTLRFFEDWGGAFSPHVWRKLEGLLEEYVRLARQHGVRPVIVAFPVRYQVEAGPLFDYPQQRLKEISRSLEVPYLDLLPVLRSESTTKGMTERPLFLDHCHLTPHGNEVVAEAIYEFLKRPAVVPRWPGLRAP